MNAMQRIKGLIYDWLGIVSPSRYFADDEYFRYVHRHKRFTDSIRYLEAIYAIQPHVSQEDTQERETHGA